MAEGLVVGVVGPQFDVLVDGREVACSLRGRLKKDKQRTTSLVVVGDRVEVTLQADGSGAIEAVSPRRTELLRPGFAGRTRLVAANLDQLVIVQATREPAFNRNLVERFLALASRGRLEALVVVNKSDLEDEATVLGWTFPLRENGVRVLLTSVKAGRGIDELREQVRGRMSAMAGPSGVGKSSLVNALDPEFRPRTAAVSAWSQKGRHTTSASRLYPFGDGYLADTPGIRELALFEDSGEAIDAVFPEIEALAQHCRFRSCSHSHEPDCAVKAAVAEGAISAERYQNFLKLHAGD